MPARLTRFLRNSGMDMSRREFLQAGIGTAMRFGSTLQGSPQRKDLAFLSISELSELIRTRKTSPVEITQTILERIEKLNPALNAYITITPDLAMKAAQEAETEIRRKKWRRPLHGVPVAV